MAAAGAEPLTPWGAAITTIQTKASTLLYCNGPTDPSVDGTLRNLHEHGFAVRPDVLAPDETDDLFARFVEGFEHITQAMPTPFKYDDPSTYRTVTRDLLGHHGGLFQHWGIGHLQPVWDIRANRRVAEVSAAFHTTPVEGLLVSMDGVTLGLAPLIPDNVRDAGLYKDNVWLHLDQAPSRTAVECVQTEVLLRDAGVGDGTFRVLAGSHKFHAEFVATFGLRGNTDWCKLTPPQLAWYRARCPEYCITAPKGSQILWFSNTVHSGIQAVATRWLPEALRDRPREPRAVVYVCYEPGPPPETIYMTLDKSRAALTPDSPDYLRMTTHWPNKRKFFPKTPQTYGAPLPNVTPPPHPELSPLGKILAGLT